MMADWVADKAAAAVDRWFIEQGRDIFAAFYLYYTQGDVRIAEDLPGEGWRLAMNERISPAWTKEKTKAKIYEVLRRCPCLPREVV